MKVTAIPIVKDAFGMVSKNTERELEQLEIGERIENIQILALFRLARVLRRVLEISGDLFSVTFH